MSISEKLKDVLREEGQKFEDNLDFVKLQEFYVEMKNKGLVRKQEYNLPPLDTIGRSIYHRANLI
jgi:hypothetical protein